MSTEARLLAASVHNRNSYEVVRKHAENTLSETGKVVLGVIGDYYDRDSAAKHVDPDALLPLTLRTVSNPKHKQAFETAVQRILETDVSSANVAYEVLSAKREALEAQVSSLLLEGNPDEAKPLMEELLELHSTSELKEEAHTTLNAPTVDDLVGAEGEQGNLIPCYPVSLNNRLEGGCQRGHHVLVFGRPEKGKTLFLINMIRGFLRHGHRVLYVGNEEPVKLTALRIIQRLVTKPRAWVLEHKEEAIAAAKKAGYDNLYMQQLTPGTAREIEALCQRIKPDVLVVDQLRHLSVKEDSFTRQLEKAANAVRQVGSRHNCLVVSVTQAGESAANKAILDMEDVDFSNTGVQGAVDVMIGIGATKQDEQANRRIISLPKNKRSGRHDFFAVEVDIPTNRIISSE